MDDVQNDGVEVIITKRGVPVARMVPVEPEEKVSPFGWMKGSVIVNDDVVSSDPEDWPEPGPWPGA
jgi:antitoxin (DNA-binding transcriptional repressor) of toxin-antitoxin stability system